MASTYGKVKAFNPAVDDWDIYQEKLQFYFAANGIEDSVKKRSILLTVCGDSTFKLLRSLVPNGKLDAEAVTYDSLVDMLKSHYSKKQSTIVHRFNFNTRNRKQNESIADYVAALRELALHCKFTTKEILEEMLRDRLVCGINHQGIQRKLLSADGELTYDSALKLALTVEASERDSKHLGAGENSNKDVHLTVSGATPRPKGGNKITCYRCGGPHLAPQCKHLESVCHFCKKKGHLATVCRSKASHASSDKPPPALPPSTRDHGSKKKPSKHTNQVNELYPSDSEHEYDMHALTDKRSAPYMLDIELNNIPVQMELDTGAAVSIISESTYDDIRQRSFVSLLQPADSTLRTYTGHEIEVLGITKIKVRYEKKKLHLSIHVVKGSGPSLLGRDWLTHLEVNLKHINTIESDHAESVQRLLDKYPSVFKGELGCLKGAKVRLNVYPDARPKFYKPRSVPFIQKDQVNSELDNLLKLGVISPVQFSSWAAPIVPVLKKSGKTRICGDYKLTINQASPTDSYPLPIIEEIFANLSGGTLFSKLDLANAFHQLPLDDDSKEYLTINTQRGLFEYNRLPFGVASAPSIFQRYIDSVLQGMTHVSAYIDDIIVTGPTVEEHLQNLEEVLKRLDAANLRLRRDKCFYLRPRIEYLGHIIDKDGLHPIESKVQAIKDAPEPTNVT